MTAFVFRKAAASHDAAYHDVCVLQRRLPRFNCCNIFFPLLEWGISLLINYRTLGWCWELLHRGIWWNSFLYLMNIHTFSFPLCPSSRSQVFEEQKGPSGAMFLCLFSWQRHYKDSERFEKAVCSEWCSSLPGLFMYSWALTSIVRAFKKLKNNKWQENHNQFMNS